MQVAGGAGGDHAQEIADDDTVGGCAADPFGRVGGNAAGTVGTETATDAEFAETAFHLLFGEAVEGGVDVGPAVQVLGQGAVGVPWWESSFFESSA
jgi:hypothetical protein